jgi:hypothetical protein
MRSFRIDSVKAARGSKLSSAGNEGAGGGDDASASSEGGAAGPTSTVCDSDDDDDGDDEVDGVEMTAAIHLCVCADVHEGKTSEFLEHTALSARLSRAERGVLQFVTVQREDNPNQVRTYLLDELARALLAEQRRYF